MNSEGDARLAAGDRGKGRIVDTREDTQGFDPQEADAEAAAVALASLGREQRQVIMCTFYGHLSVEDTAARLGISVHDVKRHASAALTEIRRMLRQRGVPIPRQPAA